MRRAERRVQLEAFPVGRHGAIEVARIEQGVAHHGVDEQVERIELERPLGLGDRFPVAPHAGQKQRISAASEGITRIELDGLQALALGGRPIPVVETMNPAEGRVELGQRVIEREPPLGGLASQRVAFARRRSTMQ